MGMKCPIFDNDNLSDSKHNKDCDKPLSSFEEVPRTHTLTINTSIDEITTSTTLAVRLQIIQEREKSGKD
jgi:hypothetical protein